MPVSIIFNQAGKPAGVAGKARDDTAVGVPIVCTSSTLALAYVWVLRDVPIRSALTRGTTSVLPTLTFTPDVKGTYLISLQINGSLLPGDNAVSFCAVLSNGPNALGWRYLGAGEVALDNIARPGLGFSADINVRGWATSRDLQDEQTEQAVYQVVNAANAFTAVGDDRLVRLDAATGRVNSSLIPGALGGGGSGWVRVTDVQLQVPGAVTNKIYDDAGNTVIRSATVSNGQVRLIVESSYPNIKIDTVPVQLPRVGDIYRGPADTTISGVGPITVVSQAVNADDIECALDNVELTLVSPPTILTLAFAAQGGGAGGAATYPGTQTELKAGDVVRLVGTTDIAADAIQCDNTGACGSQVVTFATSTSFSVLVTVADRGISVQSLIARVSARDPSTLAFGTTRDTNQGGGTVDGVDLVKLNNLYPTINGFTGAAVITGHAFTIAYPGSQTALKDAEAASITNTASNYDTILYSSPVAELAIASATTFANPKVVTRSSGTYNIATDNFSVSATRTANAATKTVRGVVAIAHVDQVITVSTPYARLRSGGNNGTTVQDYTITISSDQQLLSAPSLAPQSGGAKGTFQGGGFVGGPSSWTRALRVSETVPDLKGTFTWANLSTTNRAGKVVTAIAAQTGPTNGPTYTLGGFVARAPLVFFPGFSNTTQLNVEVSDFSKLTAGTFTATTNTASKQPIGTSPPVIDGYTIDAVSVNPTTVIWLDTNAVNSNSSGTAAITGVEELV